MNQEFFKRYESRVFQALWIKSYITFIDHKIDLHGIEEFVWHTLSFDHDKIVKSGYLHKTLSSLISVSSTTEKIFQHHSIIFTTRFSKYFLPWQTISAESGSISKIPPKSYQLKSKCLARCLHLDIISDLLFSAL